MTTPTSGPVLTYEEALNRPLPSGSFRTLWCTRCGAVTGILSPDGVLNGDPLLHDKVCPQVVRYNRRQKRRWSWPSSRKENR